MNLCCEAIEACCETETVLDLSGKGESRPPMIKKNEQAEVPYLSGCYLGLEEDSFLLSEPLISFLVEKREH